MKRLSQTDGSAESFVIFYVSQDHLGRAQTFHSTEM